jgi:hypothetical protein
MDFSHFRGIYKNHDKGEKIKFTASLFIILNVPPEEIISPLKIVTNVITNQISQPFETFSNRQCVKLCLISIQIECRSNRFQKK